MLFTRTTRDKNSTISKAHLALIEYISTIPNFGTRPESMELMALANRGSVPNFLL